MGVLALLDEECLLLPRSTDKVWLRPALGKRICMFAWATVCVRHALMIL